MCSRHTEKQLYKRVDSIYDDFSNKQQRVADCADVFPAVLEGSYQFFRLHHPRLRSKLIERMKGERVLQVHTAAAKSSIAFPAMSASS
jgi:hypothetical protein